MTPSGLMSPPRSRRRPPPRTGFTVFVVDDSEGIRTSMEHLCEAEGLAVETYASAGEFLEAFDERRRGCLFLDLRLGASHGLDLQDELRRRDAALPVIIMTGYGDVPSSVRAFRGGAVDFLQKPVPAGALLQRIRGLMDADRRQQKAVAANRDVLRRIESLTPREREIMHGLVDGLISKEIAHQLGISTRTVEGHRRAVLRKMGVASAAQLVRAVISSRGELPPS